MAKKHPKVSVLVPTFNRAQYLAECLDSILAQTVPATQIIVINNGSTDHTKKLCESYAGKIEYLEMGQLGKSAAVNYGLERASGDYIWILDDDDVAFPDAIERFVEPLEKNPEYGFSYSSSFYSSTNMENGRIGSIMFEKKLPDTKTRGFLIPLLEKNFLSGGTVFARASCYKKIGGFVPELLRSQDYEMAIRLARHFKAIRVSGGPTFHYRQHVGVEGISTNNSFTKSERQKKWLEYNQKFFRQLYHEMPLSDYLPPGYTLDKKARQALLQRLAIMANKLLIPEVINDLRDLALSNDKSPFSKEEYSIIRNIIMTDPYFYVGNIFEHLEFFKVIHRLAVSSPVIRLLRVKVARAVLARYRNEPGTNKISEIIRCLFYLYF